MTWDIIKGILIAFPIFIIMGLIANLIGALAFTFFDKIKSNNINGFLKVSIFISLLIGGACFFIMGMFYASFTLFLSSNFPKWLSIVAVSIFLIVISGYTSKEIKSLHSKNVTFSPSDFFHSKNRYVNHIQVVNENVLLGSMALFPSYIFFLIFNNLADTLSLGLNSLIMSFFNA